MKDESAGLLAAAFIGIVPGYISRSVAGSYDNEAIAIFLLMFKFYCWIKALKTGSAFFGTVAALFYFYMVAAWGVYLSFRDCVLLINFAGSRWLRIHHKHDSPARACAYSHGQVQQSVIRRVLVVVCCRNARQHAGSLRWIPTCAH